MKKLFEYYLSGIFLTIIIAIIVLIVEITIRYKKIDFSKIGEKILITVICYIVMMLSFFSSLDWMFPFEEEEGD